MLVDGRRFSGTTSRPSRTTETGTPAANATAPSEPGPCALASTAQVSSAYTGRSTGDPLTGPYVLGTS